MPLTIVESLGLPPFTVNETAGMVVGAAIIFASVNASKLDTYIARVQRRDLGLCLDCGGLARKVCRNCKGRGIEGGGPLASLRIGLGVDPFGTVPTNSAGVPKGCKRCNGSGHFPCPTCTLKA